MRKALIIDDSSFSVRRLKKVMDELGFESVGVSNGPDALDALLGFVDGARALLRALLEGSAALIFPADDGDKLVQLLVEEEGDCARRPGSTQNGNVERGG